MRDSNRGKKKAVSGKSPGWQTEKEKASPTVTTSGKEKNVSIATTDAASIDEHRSTFRRRAVVSNWSRYEEEPEQDGDTGSRGADFSQLLISSSTVNSEYQFKSDVLTSDISGSEILNEYMSIDCESIAASLMCVDLITRLQLNPAVFEGDQLKRFQQKAEECRTVCAKNCASQSSSTYVSSMDVPVTSADIPMGSAVLPVASAAVSVPSADVPGDSDVLGASADVLGDSVDVLGASADVSAIKVKSVLQSTDSLKHVTTSHTQSREGTPQQLESQSVKSVLRSIDSHKHVTVSHTQSQEGTPHQLESQLSAEKMQASTIEGKLHGAEKSHTLKDADTASSNSLNVGSTESIQQKSSNVKEISQKRNEEKTLEELEDDLDSLLSI